MTDTPGARLERTGRTVLRRLAEHLDESVAGGGPAIRLTPIGQLADELRLADWIRQGGMDADSVAGFVERYLEAATRLHHPGYMAHQVAVPHHGAALAELIHGVTNNAMAIYEMGPAAAAAELAVLDWMLDAAGWPRARWPGDTETREPRGAGVLTHGGSLANLTVLLAARATAAPEAWQDGVPGDLALLAAPDSHYSVTRAAAIMGLGERSVYPLEVDGRGVVRPDGLEDSYRRALDDGRRVFAVVANAPATGTGLYDPIEAMGRFCREHGLWFHVDGAHGAAALLSDRERHRLRGLELADSLIWDAHKMLRTSTLCAAVLFRDERAFDRAFQQEAAYLFYGEDREIGVDLITRTVECTKSGLGLKLFMTLAFLGEEGLARYVEDRFELARRAHRTISNRPGFECPYEPESNVLCFRYGEGDDRQIAIREALLREGRYYVSSTEVGGARYLRLSIMSPATDGSTIEGLLDSVERIVERL